MFGEISLLAWMGSAIVFAIGGGAGFFVARQIKDKRTLELEQQLQATQNKLSEYQSDVNRHFLKSSLLFNKLTENYREVYEHLASGAQKLCNEKPITTALDLPDTKILSAAISTRTAGVNENMAETDVILPIITEAKPNSSVQHASEPASKLESEQEEEENLGVESITTHQTILESSTEASATNVNKTFDTESADNDKTRTSDTAATQRAAAKQTKNQSKNDAPTITAKELEILEANEQKEDDTDDVHLGAESTPGVELEHHKTHPGIH